jgi:hypothetical protein
VRKQKKEEEGMKRKGAAKKDEPKSKRIEIQKQIATSRAPHFARAEKLKPAISSTPTGVYTQLQKSSTQGKAAQSHPLVLSTTHSLLKSLSLPLFL